MADGPWERRTVHLVGGLTEIGFVPGTNLLLVASHQGRGLIDCTTGEHLARDRDEDQQGWFDESRPAVLGIGPVADRWIDVSGLRGGEPIATTDDGWVATRRADDVDLEGPAGRQRLSAGAEELRAYGFSPDGMYFVLATPGDVSIFGRVQRTGG